jgi:formylglycine-generating enzyme required for sulfatase activity
MEMKKLLYVVFLLFVSLLDARDVSHKDLELRFGKMYYFGFRKSPIIKFGGYSTPECRFAIRLYDKKFFFKELHSLCWQGTNSNGVQIVCNYDKSVCKTKKELLAFLNSSKNSNNKNSNDIDTKPSWCKSKNLNSTESTICNNSVLYKLDNDLSKVYGNAKAKRQDIKQLAWLKKRNSCYSDVECIKNMYEDRIKQLQDITKVNTKIVSNDIPIINEQTTSNNQENVYELRTFKNQIGMKFVEIPDGSFLMHYKNKPQAQKVNIKGFYMATTEVTQKQWMQVMGSNPSAIKNGNHNPVENISWEDVQKFIKKLNKMDVVHTYILPTEEQWEYATRAGSKGKWFFGNDKNKLEDYAWYIKNSSWKHHPVAEKKPNKWGLYDVYGNVDEITSTKDHTFMVVRGGNSMSIDSVSDSNSRRTVFLEDKSSGIGFRVACLKD